MANKKQQEVASDERPTPPKAPQPAGEVTGKSFEERGREMDKSLGRENRH